MDKNLELFSKRCADLGIKLADRVLLVNISTQTLRFYRQGKLMSTHIVSTSLRPPSNLQDSLGTPRGLHEIAERIGGEQPAGMVFKGRRPTGRHYSETTDDGNLITSRILRLRGLEPGINAGRDTKGRVVDTHARYVYIHGTNREDRLGQPQSAGCVLMSNHDIVTLFDQVLIVD